MLSDKVVIVTGGAGLLGKAFCHAIASYGATAIVADLDLKKAESVATSIRSEGFKAYSAMLNITEKNSVDNMIEELDHQYGRIDAVVNNAYPRNKNYGRKLEEVEYIDFCENVNMHLGGYFLVAQRFAMYFSRSEHGGNIINMSSIYGSMAPRFDIYEGTLMTMPVEYAAIKSAITHLTKYFAQYFKSASIRCNTLSPGGILDGQPEPFLKEYRKYCASKGMLDSTDLEGSLIYLLSDLSRHVTGQNIIVDDGYSL